MKIRVLNFLDKEKVVNVKGKIIYIEVLVVSGDEIVYVVTEKPNGVKEIQIFDAQDRGTRRAYQFRDGGYGVTPENIERWNQRTTQYEALYGDYGDPNLLQRPW